MFGSVTSDRHSKTPPKSSAFHLLTVDGTRHPTTRLCSVVIFVDTYVCMFVHIALLLFIYDFIYATASCNICRLCIASKLSLFTVTKALNILPWDRSLWYSYLTGEEGQNYDIVFVGERMAVSQVPRWNIWLNMSSRWMLSVAMIINERCIRRTNLCTIAMMFVRLSVCLGRACIVIIQYTLAWISLHS